ncbi:hypothetical protein I4U23_019521 [Adineta vaga]|nr:hypothetical protein I4U23_019521 [Adineta vaga]
MTGRLSCDLCVEGHGICIKNNTECQCFAGYGGPSCLDRIIIASSDGGSSSTVNIGAIVAGILAGVLVTLVIGLVLFCLRKRKRDKRKAATTFSLSTPTDPKPMPVSTLYNFPISQYDSSISSTSTMAYHLYEELP